MKSLKLTGILAGVTLLSGAVFAVGAASAASAADALQSTARGEHARRIHHPSLGRIIFGNALVKELSMRTGRPAVEIETMLRENGPRETAETLGLDRDAMKESMQSAHKKAIAQAQQAQLITAEQAQALLEAPPPQRGKHHHPDADDEGEAGES